MEKPDADGFVNITWPSKNVPHGGIFHTRVAEPTSGQQQFLKALLEESKLSIALRARDRVDAREELRQSNAKLKAEPRVECRTVRPRTSRRRSLSAIRHSGMFDVDEYKPLQRGEDREKMKDRLANTMQFGDSEQQPPPPAPRAAKPRPALPTTKQAWNEIVNQIRERAEWLAEMEYLGEGAPHREIISDQIAERMRALDALGVESTCSSARSSATGFSTTRSREPATDAAAAPTQRSASTNNSRQIGSVRKSQGSQGSQGGARARTGAKQENVASYGQLSPLQYSPRRRV